MPTGTSTGDSNHEGLPRAGSLLADFLEEAMIGSAWPVWSQGPGVFIDRSSE